MPNRTRRKDDQIASFCEYVRLNAQSLDPEAQKMLALQHFYQNVSPGIRCRLMDNDCRSIRDAVEIVEMNEDVLGRTKVSHIRGTCESNEKEQTS